MRVRIGLILVSVISFFAACGGDSPSAPSGSGMLNVRITDSPYSDARALLVTFSEVSAHRADTSDGGWSRLNFESGSTRTCDLKKLVNAQDVLGVGPLASGHYTQLRLTVTNAVLYFDNPSTGPACAASIPTPAGASAPVQVSSGEVKLNRQFDVPEGGATTILIDFDGDKSVIQQGNGAYRMSPVIGIVSVQ
jgi:hypothetical protein